MRKLFVVLITLCIVNVYGQNRTLPDISIKNVHGVEKSIQSYATNGKISIFSFWATWCAPCKKELNNISEIYDDWKKEYGLEVIAVSIDNARNVAKVKPYVDGQAWDYEVLLDTNEEFKRAMNVQTVPFTVLVDKSGKIVYTHTGYVEGDEFNLEEEIQKIK
ncbi:MAG: TlpA family protein disulfide reductase [Bacteroidia bacterium]|nr:TlpA family protein disulfide reductase [Bacteroidia bacterium]